MSSGKKPPRKRVLADHKQKGKKFIPPLMQVGKLDDAHWVKQMIPEFLWLALLPHACGYAAGVEVARKTAELARRVPSESHRWFAGLSDFKHIPEDSRDDLISSLAAEGLLDNLRLALSPLQFAYPDHPLNYALGPEPGEPDLVALKQVLAEMFPRRATTAMRAQATALYLAFDAGFLKVAANSALADFPEVSIYPTTERSKQVAAAVRAALNGLTIRLEASRWPDYFWNRGLELEPCELAEPSK